MIENKKEEQVQTQDAVKQIEKQSQENKKQDVEDEEIQEEEYEEVEEEEEVEINVSLFKFDGIKYYIDDERTVYDYETRDKVGVFIPEKNLIDTTDVEI